MSSANEQTHSAKESGYGAAKDGDRADAPDQVQPERRPPPSPEEDAQDDYANASKEGVVDRR
jgi:hypothetical protein